jgi:transcriptional regulator with XRE-family HTH domain
MPDQTIDLGRRGFAPLIADVVREARLLIGLSQRELARRADTSQATIWRIEGGRADHLDLLVVERVLRVLGIRATLTLDARHLADRRRQLDAVHARLVGYVARRLERVGWLTAAEVPLGDGTPRGWIDLMAFRETDATLLVDETKTEIPDLGALGRSLAFYEREAWSAARSRGWQPRRAVVLVTALDSVAIARRLSDNRELVGRMFPALVDGVARWLADPRCESPRGWALGTVDPASRADAWVRPTTLGSRRRAPAYEDYADAAARLRRRR